MNQFQLLKRKEIDEQKWNSLINVSVNSLPYALSYYLDAVAENWEAIVLNDYEAVMPLVWLRKFGFKCLYQPYYCQQLGVFSEKILSPQKHNEFITAAQKFPYININLNPSAKIIADEFSFTRKKNLLLDLSNDYAALRKNYSENHRRNILKAEKRKLQFLEEATLLPFQKFYLENVKHTKEIFKPQHEKIFKALTKILVAKRTAKIFSAVDEEGNLLAATFLLFHQNRIINLINTSSALGKKNGASHFLFDQIIQKFSSHPSVIASQALRAKQSTSNYGELIFDFEGSSIVSIARFYEGFGAQEEVFYNYHTTIAKKLRQRFQ